MNITNASLAMVFFRREARVEHHLSTDEKVDIFKCLLNKTKTEVILILQT